MTLAVYLNKAMASLRPVGPTPPEDLFFMAYRAINVRSDGPGQPADGVDEPQLRARLQQLEALCRDLLVASVDLKLPQALLHRLWAVSGHGDVPQAFAVDLPPVGSTTPAPPAPGAMPAVAPISLDLAPIDSAARPGQRPARAEGGELRPFEVEKTVLVVDDDEMMLDVLLRILQRENFRLVTARSGADAVATLAEVDGTLDLLITDYAMPGMHGRELADRVRQRCPAVRVLYETGFSDKLFENRAELEEGAAFLEKPFTARGLREAARLALFGTINP